MPSKKTEPSDPITKEEALDTLYPPSTAAPLSAEIIEEKIAELEESIDEPPYAEVRKHEERCYDKQHHTPISEALPHVIEEIRKRIEKTNKDTKNDGAPGTGAHNTRLMNRFRSLENESKQFLKFLKDEGYNDA